MWPAKRGSPRTNTLTIDIHMYIYLSNHNPNLDLFNQYKLDLNTDGDINILDVVEMVNIILD